MSRRVDVLAPEQLEALERFKEFDGMVPSRFPKEVRGPHWMPDVLYPMFRTDRLLVMVSIDRLAGRDWYHVSYRMVMAKHGKDDLLPTHKDTCYVRETFFKSDALVVAVFPPVAEYVNFDQRVLHLWQRIGADRLIPDLRQVMSEEDREEFEKRYGTKAPARTI